MIRLIIAGIFLLIALFTFFTEVLGFFRFKYILDRIHAAGLGDTMGIMCIAIAVSILWANPSAILKTLLIVVFMMLTGPVLTHLLANMEFRSHKNAGHEYDEEDRA